MSQVLAQTEDGGAGADDRALQRGDSVYSRGVFAAGGGDAGDAGCAAAGFAD